MFILCMFSIVIILIFDTYLFFYRKKISERVQSVLWFYAHYLMLFMLAVFSLAVGRMSDVEVISIFNIIVFLYCLVRVLMPNMMIKPNQWNKMIEGGSSLVASHFPVVIFTKLLVVWFNNFTAVLPHSRTKRTYMDAPVMST